MSGLHRIFLPCLLAATSLSALLADDPVPEPKPIRVQVLYGGGIHDDATLVEIIKAGLEARLERKLAWKTREIESDDETFEWPQNADKTYETQLVIHLHCLPGASEKLRESLLAPHRAGVPALLIHGTLRSFGGSQEWTDLSGATLETWRRSGPLGVQPISSSKIGAALRPWKVVQDEIYPVRALGKATEAVAELVLENEPSKYPGSWTNRYGASETRVFTSVFGHQAATVAQNEYLDTLAQALVWLTNGDPAKDLVAAPSDALSAIEPLRIAPVLPSPGGNLAPSGQARAWSETSEHPASAANDGRNETYWLSSFPGATQWELDLGAIQPVGAVALIWTGEVPEDATVSVSTNLRDWQVLEDRAHPLAGGYVEVSAVKGRWRHLRIQVHSLAAGTTIGLREVALYAAASQVPLALSWEAGIREDDASSPSGIAGDRTGTDGFLEHTLAPACEVVQWKASAESGIFVMEGNDQHRHITWVKNSGEGGCGSHRFLSDLPPDATMAWDGEWVWVVARGQLSGHRRIGGGGLADETLSRGTLLRSQDDSAKTMPKFSEMSLGLDGWLVARASASEGGLWWSREGDVFDLRHPLWVRFRCDGTQLQRLRAPLLDNADFPSNEPSGGWSLLVESESSGRVRQWRRAGLSEPPGKTLDELTNAEVVACLESSEELWRREARFEIFRRHRLPWTELTGLLQDKQESGLLARHPRELLWAIGEVAGGEAWSLLRQVAESGPPAARAAAFSVIAQRGEAKNHAIFSALSREREPLVSLAIIEAIRESGTDYPRMDELLFSLAEKSTPELSIAAKNLMIERRKIEACWNILEDPAEVKRWPMALQVVASLRSPSVASALIEKFQQSDGPLQRRALLETLARLHGELPPDHEKDQQLIVAFLNECLSHRRVDPVWLVNEMVSQTIPLENLGRLVELAEQSIPLEAMVVERLLLETETPLSAGKWLASLVADSAREDNLRGRALSLLASIPDEKRLEKMLPQLQEWKGIDANADIKAEARRRWWSNPAHSRHLPWLITATNRKELPEATMAWQALLTVSATAGDDLTASARTELQAAIDTTLAKAGSRRTALLEAAAAIQAPELEEWITSIPAADGADAAAEIAELARRWGRDERTGALLPTLGEMADQEILNWVAERPGKVDRGREFFSRMSCRSCHDITGEGSRWLPDLTSLNQRTDAEILASLRPAKPAAREQSLFRASLPGPTPDKPNHLVFDSAGNDVTALAEAWAMHHERFGPPLRNHHLEAITVAEFADLWAFLKQLEE
jgi:F5/8 type C domain